MAVENTPTASEKAVEDVFAQSPAILSDVIGEGGGILRLVERQQKLPTGVVDLVFLAGDDVLLIELKVVTATDDHVNQIQRYIDAYNQDIPETEFAQDRNLRPILLAPSIPVDVTQACNASGIHAERYEVGQVMKQFQDDLFGELSQFRVQGYVTGVARLGLMNRYLKFVADSDEPVSTKAAANEYEWIGKRSSSAAEDRIRHFQKTCRDLDLLSFDNEGATLTPRGGRYVEHGDFENRPWAVTSDQAAVINELLYDSPFYSDFTFSLLSFAETVFELSKNSRPVHRDQLKDSYAKKVGKAIDWNNRTRKDVARWGASFTEELGLITVVDKQYYLTPKGFNLISYTAIEGGKEMIKSQRQRTGDLESL